MSDKSPIRDEGTGILFPVDFSFEATNEFAHHSDVTFEELQGAILSMAAHFEKETTALRNESN